MEVGTGVVGVQAGQSAVGITEKDDSARRQSQLPHRGDRFQFAGVTGGRDLAVAIGGDDDRDVLAALQRPVDDAAGEKRLIVWMWREHDDLCARRRGEGYEEQCRDQGSEMKPATAMRQTPTVERPAPAVEAIERTVIGVRSHQAPVAAVKPRSERQVCAIRAFIRV